MFLAALFMLIIGFPVAFTFGAIAVFFGAIYAFVQAFEDNSTEIFECKMSIFAIYLFFIQFFIFERMEL